MVFNPFKEGISLEHGVGAIFLSGFFDARVGFNPVHGSNG